MPAGKRGSFGVAAIRLALRRRVEATSIRATAREVGMSPSGLHVLLQGSRPHPLTRKKLVDWYLTRAAPDGQDQPEIAGDDVDAALNVLMRYVAANGRAPVRRMRVREISTRLFGAPLDDE